MLQLLFWSLTLAPCARHVPQQLARPALSWRAARITAMVADEVLAENPKGLSGPLITYAGISPEMRILVDEAFTKRNRERTMTDKAAYESIDSMIEAYVEIGAEQSWTRLDAESEVVRFLQRRALVNEGGFTGAPQDYAAQVMLVLLLGTAGYSTASGGAVAWENPFF